MKELWEEREETGDFIVKNDQDEKTTMKFHSAILISIPFFKTKINQIQLKNSNSHLTELQIDSFISFIQFIYLNSFDHFNVSNSIEILDEKIGIQFYFCGEKNQKLIDFLKLKTNEKIDEKDCLKVLLLSSIRNIKSSKQNSIHLIPQLYLLSIP